jgi:DNA repair exonuclease SbcCD ATPase subunit
MDANIEVFANYNDTLNEPSQTEPSQIDVAFDRLLEQRTQPLLGGMLSQEELNDEEKICNTNLHTATLFKMLNEQYKTNSAKVEEYDNLMKELRESLSKTDKLAHRLKIININSEESDQIDKTYQEFRKVVLRVSKTTEDQLITKKNLVDIELESITRKLNALRSLIVTGVNEIVKPRDIQKKMCPVCFDNEVNTALVPCGHTYCRSCSEMDTSRFAKCPQCRATINTRIKIFFSI